METLPTQGLQKPSLSRLAVAVRRAIPSLILAALPVYADTSIPSGRFTYNLTDSSAPYVLSAPNVIDVALGEGILGSDGTDWILTIANGATVNAQTAAIDVGSSTLGGTIVNLDGQVTTTARNDPTSHAGIRFSDRGTLNISSTGSVNSASTGVYFNIGGTINNSGTIIAASNGPGVYFNINANNTFSYIGETGSVLQAGTGILVSAAGTTILNRGTITAAQYGVEMTGAAAGSIDNQAGGVIQSTATGSYGLYINNSGTTTITNEGTISAGTAIALLTNGHSIASGGTLTGTEGTALLLSGSNNTVSLLPGSTVTGDITSTGSGNTLTLTGIGVLNGQFSGLQNVTANAGNGNTWTIDGAAHSTTGTDAQALWVQTGTLLLLGSLTHSGTNGGTTINSDATLQLGNATRDGAITGNISNDGSLVVVNGGNTSLDGQISGNGSLEQRSSGTTTVSGDNSYTGPTKVNGGTLQATHVNALGGSSAEVSSAGTLELAFSNGDFTNSVANNGTLNVSGAGNTLDGTLTGSGLNLISAAGTTIAADNSAFSGNWQITQAGEASISGSPNLGSGGVQVDGLLQLNNSSDVTFSNALSGSGEMDVALAAGKAFTLGSGVGALFSGTLQLGNSLFDLSGINTSSLTNATLKLDAGNETTVGAGTQAIGNLNLNGGTLIFTGSVPPNQADGTIAVTNLDVNSGIVRVDTPTAGLPNPATTGANLLIQDDAAILTRLVAASGSVNGSLDNVTLQDSSGNALSALQQFDITEGGTAVAQANYDYGLSTGNVNNGLYVSYGLISLNLLSGQTLHLEPDSGASGGGALLIARLTGDGNLDVNASPARDQTVTLGDRLNNYTGTTTVSGGTLRLGSDNALGNTSQLTVNSGTSADINGHTQTVGALFGAGGVDINGGNLTVSNGGAFDGVMSGGSGTLTLAGGGLVLSGANTFTGSTTINSGATLQVGSGLTLGSIAGPVVDNGMLTFNRSDNVTFGNSLTGSGQLTQMGSGTLFITSDVGITGPVTISNGILSLGDGTTDGSVVSDIVNNGALVFNRSDWQYGGAISGNGTVSQVSSHQTTLSGNNTYNGGTIISGGVLNAASATALGTGAVINDNGAGLTLSFTNGTFSNDVLNNGVMEVTGRSNTLSGSLVGTGINRISALNTTLAGNNTSFAGSWDITSSGVANVSEQQNLGGSDILLNGQLNLDPVSGGWAFTNVLTGNGKLAVALANGSDIFAFSPTAGTDFSGTLAMLSGTMALDSTNSAALANATLSLGTGGTATLDADRTIGNLAFSGGTLDAAMTSVSTSNVLTVDHLSVDAGTAGSPGVVNLRTATLPPDTAPTGNLLDQDDPLGNGILVVSASTVSNAGKQIATLFNGAAQADQVDQIADGYGNSDLLATYGYVSVISAGNNASAGPGLYTGYLLKVLNSQSNAILDTTGATDSNVGAQLTGVGNFTFQGHNETITVLNANNDYQGETTVANGTLRMGDDHTLGNTSALNLAAGATADINGFTQTIGALNGAAGSTLALNDGALSISNGGQSDGQLTGGGSLNLDGGELVVSNTNANLSADVAIGSAASARLSQTSGLGSGDIALDGALILDTLTGALANTLSGGGSLDLVNSQAQLSGDNSNFTGNIGIDDASQLTVQQPAALGSAAITDDGELVIDTSSDWMFNNALDGSGLLTKTGSGTLFINGDAAQTGGTDVAAGTLALGNAAATLSGGGPVSVADGATLGGYGTIVGDVTSNGTVAAGSALSVLNGNPGNLTIQGNLDNFNTVTLAGNAVGNTLTVTGNYTAHSTLILNTNLGGDSSATDKLIVRGDTAGHTNVYVYNKGGSGAATVNGIQVVEVDGASNGTFALANRVVAGAYDYNLYQGTPTSNDGDWYLRASGGNNPTPPDPNNIPIRPEAGGYLANEAAAINMFSHTLHDRLGESLFVTGENAQASSAWGRIFGRRTDSRAAGQIGQDTWNNGVQLGFDLANNLEMDNRWQVGVMGGYGKARSSSVTDDQPYTARSDVEGYSVGLYGTWFADGRPNGTGPYVDSWMQYGWYNNTVQGDQLPSESYDSRTQAVSVETGWAFNVYNASQMRFFLQPQEQVIYTHYSADNVTEQNGTRVKSKSDGGVVNRLGLRAWGFSEDEAGRRWQPFVEVNWLYSSDQPSISMDGQQINSDIPRHRYEVKTGLETKLANNWNMWANIGTQQGSDNYRQLEGNLGVKYSW